MLASNIVIASFVALASATSPVPSDEVFAALLKRQAPGSPSYNCHDNCGTAITLSRQPNKCSIDAFKTNYNNCLKCAGPDNYNIWRMYGNTLSGAGASCGFSTEPLAGKQDDVGAAVHVGTSSGVAAATPAAVGTTASVSPAVPVITSSTPSSVISAASASRNATASITSSVLPQQSTNAGTHIRPAGIFGAVVVGAIVVL